MPHIKHVQSTETITTTPHISHILAAEARLSRIHRLFKKNFNVTEPSLILEPYLFLGNCISAQDINRLSKLGIRYILNVAIRDVELCPYYSSDMRILTIDLRDDDQENIIRIFNEAFSFINQAKESNSRVLVHCSHGQSRSPAIVIAYLMNTYDVPLEQCLIHVIKARPCVLPNDGFLKQLILFDRFLAERRRKRQEAADREAAQCEQPTEIPIEHQPSIIHPSIQSNSSAHLETQTSNDQNMSPAPSPTIEKRSGSTVSYTGSGDSIHVIPIQITRTAPRQEKIREVIIKNKPVKHDIVEQEVRKKIKSLKQKPRATDEEKMIAESNREESSSNHQESSSNHEESSSNQMTSSRRRPKAYYTDIVKQTNYSIPRSHSSRSNRRETNSHYEYYSPSTASETWDDTDSYYRHDRRSHEQTRTKYITEIYDKATNRFIPTSCR